MMKVTKTTRPRLEALEDRLALATFSLLQNANPVEWFKLATWAWDQGGNPNRLPGAADTVMLGNGVNTRVMLENNGMPTAAAVMNITSASGFTGTLDLSGASLTVFAAASIAGGTVSGGNGSLIVNDTNNAASFQFTGGTIGSTNVTVGMMNGAGSTATWTGGTLWDTNMP